MPGNISQFLAELKKSGIAKASHFDVDFTFPEILLPDTETPRTLKLRCDSAELPGRQIGTLDNRIYGPIYKTPHDSIYAEMTMSFIETADMSLRAFFELWMNQIFDSDTNTIRYIDTFVSDIVVTQYDLSGDQETLNPMMSFRLIRAYPIDVNQLSVAWNDDELHRLIITFFYERYEIQDGATAPIFPTEKTLEPLAASLYQEGLGRAIVANTQAQLAIQNARVLANSYKISNTGLFGSAIQDLSNKVKGFF